MEIVSCGGFFLVCLWIGLCLFVCWLFGWFGGVVLGFRHAGGGECFLGVLWCVVGGGFVFSGWDV